MSWVDDKLASGVSNRDYLLDYSAAKISGADIRQAGYSGVIRYIDEPSKLGRKHTSKAEYNDHIANELIVYMVMQVGIADADGGWNFGVEKAQRALRGMDYLGYQGPCFFTNDRTTVPDADTWRSHLDGAVSVLGFERVGAYGFKNAIDIAVGHAHYFWQAGRKSDVAVHTNFWQDNNQQVTVGGITCDRNMMKESDLLGMEWTDSLQAPFDANAKFPAKDWITYANKYAGEAAGGVARLEEKVDNLVVGSVDLDLLADKVADKLLAKLNLKQVSS